MINKFNYILHTKYLFLIKHSAKIQIYSQASQDVKLLKSTALVNTVH